MKTLLYIICLVLSVNAFTLKSETNTIPDSFGSEYKEIIMNMESSCYDTVMNAINQVYGSKSTLLLKIKIECDYEKANVLFKKFYEKYIYYFDSGKFNDIIDSITHDKYPQYDLMWGIRFNSLKAPYIKRTMPYDVYMGNHNKNWFYSVYINNTNAVTVLASFSGYSLDYYDREPTVRVFYYKINHTISDVQEVTLKLNHNPTNYVHNAGHLSELD